MCNMAMKSHFSTINNSNEERKNLSAKDPQLKPLSVSTYKLIPITMKEKIVEMESFGYYRYPKYSSNLNLNGKGSMFGTVRVLALLIGVFVIPVTLIMLPLYLKYRVFADIYFAVTESDILEITDGISPIFCEAHTVRMNTSFNAFQVQNAHINTDQKKHFRLHKSMSVPDDSLEYWGFFLNKGSVVNLTLCSRYKGGRLMVVKDVKNFSTCGLSDPKPKSPLEAHYKQDEVRILYETNAQVIASDAANEEFEGEALSEESKQAYQALKKRYKHLQLANHTSPRDARSITQKSTTAYKEGFLHGKTNDSDSEDSSFERQLISCHQGKILFNDDFLATPQCSSIQFLEQQINHVQLEHAVHTDDYYFYIFYSDNDEAINEIHVIFDIFKPTYEYSNYSRSCLNVTECSFPISFMSEEKVVVEVPMRDGIEHESDDVTTLISTCQPRKVVYAMFTVAVLILILLFAFI